MPVSVLDICGVRYGRPFRCRADQGDEIATPHEHQLLDFVARAAVVPEYSNLRLKAPPGSLAAARLRRLTGSAKGRPHPCPPPCVCSLRARQFGQTRCRREIAAK